MNKLAQVDTESILAVDKAERREVLAGTALLKPQNIGRSPQNSEMHHNYTGEKCTDRGWGGKWALLGCRFNSGLRIRI